MIYYAFNVNILEGYFKYYKKKLTISIAITTFFFFLEKQNYCKKK